MCSIKLPLLKHNVRRRALPSLTMKRSTSQSGPPVDSFQIFLITGERKDACPVDEEKSERPDSGWKWHFHHFERKRKEPAMCSTNYPC